VTEEDPLTGLLPLMDFLSSSPLTAAVSELEHALDGCTVERISGELDARGISRGLLRSAFYARREFGRINDVIHAVAIAISLPHLLEPGETLRRPSLAAGNDPSRPFDVETDRRVAEFKLSRWDGHDSLRKRQLFKDLVHLATADIGGRTPELYVLGSLPLKFLATTSSTTRWALNRVSDNMRQQFTAHFGTLDIPVPEFVARHARHVRVIDLEELLPQHFKTTR